MTSRSGPPYSTQRTALMCRAQERMTSCELVELHRVVADHALLLVLGHARHRLFDHPPAVRPVVAVMRVVVGPHEVVDADPVPNGHRERLADERDLPVPPEVVARQHL